MCSINSMDKNGVERTLDQSLERESNLWTSFSYKERNETAKIGPNDRNNTIRGLGDLVRKFRKTSQVENCQENCHKKKKFHLQPETLALSTTITDRFLQLVKWAEPRHLTCIGAASFYLAVKIIEDDEIGIKEFVKVSECGHSVAEIHRMELCILDKLKWNLRASTPLEFLQIFHDLLRFTDPPLLDLIPEMDLSKQMAYLTRQLQRIVTDARSLIYPPSTLALALLSLELELWPQWLEGIKSLLKDEVQEVIKVNIRCRELLSLILSTRAEP